VVEVVEIEIQTLVVIMVVLVVVVLVVNLLVPMDMVSETLHLLHHHKEILAEQVEVELETLLVLVEVELVDLVHHHLQTLLVVRVEQEHQMFMLMDQLTQLPMLVAVVVVDIVRLL